MSAEPLPRVVRSPACSIFGKGNKGNRRSNYLRVPRQPAVRQFDAVYTGSYTRPFIQPHRSSPCVLGSTNSASLARQGSRRGRFQRAENELIAQVNAELNEGHEGLSVPTQTQHELIVAKTPPRAGPRNIKQPQNFAFLSFLSLLSLSSRSPLKFQPHFGQASALGAQSCPQ